ncbi:DNA phosphorothioation system restriction enzyme [Merismopedia glauca CCAP 1448/3]|uniref:DNA phosphorothioation system restriction enzyme n=1 Tax=Merismopedia glauca CCAP 1448/3 TaxID=1296344 RepID=A0A2T1C147_9CYAN|nr:DNA phosphorothioation system restriction enzyme [Merismopedia glauca CCAP 1448/3]
MLPINRLLRVAESQGNYHLDIHSQPPQGCPKIPVNLELRDYQKQAIASWFANQGRGTLKMATGSGKTITALAITTQLYQKIGLQTLLVICPFRHLVMQWNNECQKFGLEPILAFNTVYEWQTQLSTQLYNIGTKSQPFLTVITTNDTFISSSFQSQLKFFSERTLLVGDEAHNLGSENTQSKLPRNIGLRLALSATPERFFDEVGTEGLFNYFGSVLPPEFTLKNAIAQGALVHYLYYPVMVELTPSESYNYLRLTKAIGRILKFDLPEKVDFSNIELAQDLTALLMQRARLIGAAKNKLTALRQLMKQLINTTHTLFYCGDGSTESQRQLHAVTQLLGKEMGYRVSPYTAETSLLEREKLRCQFESGELQGLVAIRCLDEGVDIPAIRQAVILASTTNPRQFIQRRGRILRPHPGKERAILYDTIVLPPQLDREMWEVERSLLRKELKRLIEFADLADNAGEARVKLLQLQQQYNLLDI